MNYGKVRPGKEQDLTFNKMALRVFLNLLTTKYDNKTAVYGTDKPGP